MIRINGKNYQGIVIYNANYKGDVAATFYGGIPDEDIQGAIAAKEIASVSDDTGETLGIFALLGWRMMEKVENGLKITWQTYILNETETLKQDNEDLTQALLELADIVGGGNG